MDTNKPTKMAKILIHYYLPVLAGHWRSIIYNHDYFKYIEPILEKGTNFGKRNFVSLSVPRIRII
jgi:hypothetical protein